MHMGICSSLQSLENNGQKAISLPLVVHIPLLPQDNPLVELAELLGCAVYLISVPSLQEPPGPRYRVVSDQGVACEGTNLAEALASLIKYQQDETRSTP